MKYPMLNNWLIFTRKDRYNYNVRDALSDESFTMGIKLSCFAKKLDGKRNPYTDTSYSAEEVDLMLDILEENGFLRYNRFLHLSSGELCFSLWFPKRCKTIQIIACIFNRLLMILWFPIFVLGIIMFCRYLPLENLEYTFLGYIISTVIVLISHEIGHFVAAYSYGAPVFEVGLMIHSIIFPGGYVLMDTTNIKDKKKKIQIVAAGVESNVLWSGIFLILGCLFPTYGFACFVAALNSVSIAALNILFVEGLDGMYIVQELLGIDIDFIKGILFNRTIAKKIIRKGILGYMIFFVCWLIYTMQITIPTMILISIIEVIIGCFIF